MKKQIQNKIYGKKYAIGIAIALIVVFAFLMFNPNSGVLVKKTYTNNENFEVSRLSTVESDIIEYSFSAIESEKYYKGIYSTKVYTYDGGTPGPTIRAKVGDLVKVTLLNELDVPTTIHWHGIQLENEFDGVPGVTQDEIKPGETFTYEFVA